MSSDPKADPKTASDPKSEASKTEIADTTQVRVSTRDGCETRLPASVLRCIPSLYRDIAVDGDGARLDAPVTHAELMVCLSRGAGGAADLRYADALSRLGLPLHDEKPDSAVYGRIDPPLSVGMLGSGGSSGTIFGLTQVGAQDAVMTELGFLPAAIELCESAFVGKCSRTVVTMMPRESGCGRTAFVISRSGDICRSLTLRATIPPSGAPRTRGVLESLFNTATLSIGHREFDKLCCSANAALARAGGLWPELTNAPPADAADPWVVRMPLMFPSTSQPDSWLPLISLYWHEVTIELDGCMRGAEFALGVELVYLEKDDRRRLANGDIDVPPGTEAEEPTPTVFPSSAATFADLFGPAAAAAAAAAAATSADEGDHAEESVEVRESADVPFQDAEPTRAAAAPKPVDDKPSIVMTNKESASLASSASSAPSAAATYLPEWIKPLSDVVGEDLAHLFYTVALGAITQKEQLKEALGHVAVESRSTVLAVVRDVFGAATADALDAYYKGDDGSFQLMTAAMRMSGIVTSSVPVRETLKKRGRITRPWKCHQTQSPHPVGDGAPISLGLNHPTSALLLTFSCDADAGMRDADYAAVAPVLAAELSLNGHSTVLYDMPEMAELNWLQCGLRAPCDRRTLLIPLSRRAVERDGATVNMSRIDTVKLRLTPNRAISWMGWSVTVTSLQVNVSAVVEGMAGLRFAC